MAFAVIPRKRRSEGLVGMHDANRLVEEFFSGSSRFPSLVTREQHRSFVPSIDVVESDQAYRVTAELPGLSEEEFNIEVEDGVLTLRGEKPVREDSENECVRRNESRHGKFERKIRFREPVLQDEVTASYTDGVLTITLPRPAEERPEVRRVPIETA